MRVLWIAAELGLDYRHVPLAFDDPTLRSPWFLKLNPAAAIPTIDDDGVCLGESLAINLYLAKRYGASGPTPLYPTNAASEAQLWRWSLWAQGHLEPWVQQDALLADQRAAMGAHAQPAIRRALGVLDRALEGREWLVGEAFTVGDLNVAAVLSPSRARHLDLSPFGNVVAWLARCYGRPAALETRRRFG